MRVPLPETLPELFAQYDIVGWPIANKAFGPIEPSDDEPGIYIHASRYDYLPDSCQMVAALAAAGMGEVLGTVGLEARLYRKPGYNVHVRRWPSADAFCHQANRLPRPANPNGPHFTFVGVDEPEYTGFSLMNRQRGHASEPRGTIQMPISRYPGEHDVRGHGAALLAVNDSSELVTAYFEVATELGEAYDNADSPTARVEVNRQIRDYSRCHDISRGAAVYACLADPSFPRAEATVTEGFANFFGAERAPALIEAARAAVAGYARLEA